MHIGRILGVAFLVMLTGSLPAGACHARIMNEPDVVCRTADVIVTAVAIDYADGLPDKAETADIAFEIREVIKGHPSREYLYVDGTLTNKDDFNDAKVPYDVVRPSGLGGSYYTRDYKKGALFLFCMVYTKKGC